MHRDCGKKTGSMVGADFWKYVEDYRFGNERRRNRASGLNDRDLYS